MNNKLSVSIIALSLILFAGCHKSEPKSEPAPINTENASSQASPQAIVQAPSTAQPSPESPDIAAPQQDSDKPFEVSFNTSDFPEIHTTVSKKETDWGFIQRTTLLWYKDIEIYNEIPVFKTESPAYQKINALMEQRNQSFFTKENLESAWNYEYERHHEANDNFLDETFTLTNQFKDIQITDKYISYIIGTEWFMGGTVSYGLIPYTFDLNGNPIRLTDIYKKSDQDIKQMVVKAVKDYADKINEEYSGTDLIDFDLLNKMNEFNFYIKDDIPHVTFQKYEIAAGAAGAFDIPLPTPWKDNT